MNRRDLLRSALAGATLAALPDDLPTALECERNHAGPLFSTGPLSDERRQTLHCSRLLPRGFPRAMDCCSPGGGSRLLFGSQARCGPDRLKGRERLQETHVRP